MDPTAWKPSVSSRLAGAACVAALTAVIVFVLVSRTADYGTPSIPSASSQFVIVSRPEMLPEKKLPVKTPDAARPVPGAGEAPLKFGTTDSVENPGNGFSDWSAGPARPDSDMSGILSLRRPSPTLVSASTSLASRPRLVVPVHKPAFWPNAPSPAELEGIAGTTTMIFCISPEGQVTEVRLVGGSGSRSLDNRARAWLLDQQFEPGTQDGARVDFCGWNDFAWKKLTD